MSAYVCVQSAILLSHRFRTHLDLPLRGTDDQQRVVERHRVAALGELMHVGRVWLAQIPISEGAIPTPRHEHVELGDEDHLADGRVVRGDLLHGVRTQVPHLRLVVAARGEHLGAIAVPRAAEERRLVRLRGLGDRLPVLLHVPAANLQGGGVGVRMRVSTVRTH